MGRGVPVRTLPHESEHRASARVKGDRVNYRPTSLRSLLRWATREWELEVPSRLHDRDVADDGAPDHTPEAKRYLGMTTPGNEPDDWQRIACRVDTDGTRTTPLHCAVASLPDGQRQYARDLLTDLYHPEDIAELHGIPRWAHESLARDVLGRLWDRYAERPVPRRTRMSESQLDAEAAA